MAVFAEPLDDDTVSSFSRVAVHSAPHPASAAALAAVRQLALLASPGAPR